MTANFIELYMQYVAPAGGSERFHQWCAVTLLSAFLERRVWLDRGGGMKIHPNLYTILNGPAGCGKTTCADVAKDLAYDANQLLPVIAQIRFGPDKVTPAKLLQVFSESDKTIGNCSANFTYSSLFMYSCELSTLLLDIGGGSLTADLLVFYDARDHDILKETMSGGQLLIRRPSLVLLGATTPDFLSRYLPHELAAEGLLSRMLIITVTEKPKFSYFAQALNDKLRHTLATQIAQLTGLHGPVRLTPEARTYLLTYFERDQADSFSFRGHPVMRHYMARRHAHMTKLAICLGCARATPEITIEDVRQAAAMLADIEADMTQAFGIRDVTKEPHAIQALLDLIPQDIDLSVRDVGALMLKSGLAIRGFKALITLLDGLVAARVLNRLPDGKYRRPNGKTNQAAGPPMLGLPIG